MIFEIGKDSAESYILTTAQDWQYIISTYQTMVSLEGIQRKPESCRKLPLHRHKLHKS